MAEAGWQRINPGAFAQALLSTAAEALKPFRRDPEDTETALKTSKLTQRGSLVKEAALWLCLFPWGSSQCSSSLVPSFCSSARESKGNENPTQEERSQQWNTESELLSTYSGQYFYLVTQQWLDLVV